MEAGADPDGAVPGDWSTGSRPATVVAGVAVATGESVALGTVVVAQLAVNEMERARRMGRTRATRWGAVEYMNRVDTGRHAICRRATVPVGEWCGRPVTQPFEARF